MDLHKTNMLMDFYGSLLTKKQFEFLELYYKNDLSLAEIAEKYQISRQGVRDNIKKGCRLLEKYEEKLELLKRYYQNQEIIKSIEDEIEIVKVNSDSKGNVCRLDKVLDKIGRL